MTNYIKIEDIPGNATAQGHSDWIEIEQYHFSGRRSVNTYTGCGSDRATGKAVIGDIHITKKIDKSSPLLFQHFVKGKNIDEIILDCCQSGDMSDPYQQLILSNVMIASYNQDSKEQKEYLSLDFTKIETKYTSLNEEHSSAAPICAGFNIATAEVS